MQENSRNVLSVTEVNQYLKGLFSYDALLSAIWIRGEISNFKWHSSGHMYFTLKDASSILKSVMFKGFNGYLKFRPENGLRVVVKGSISIYEKDGVYQLYAEYMEPEGIGGLHLAFEQLKNELADIGYFDEKRKKKLPFLPHRICVVTSPTGAVIQDILHVCSRRYPNFNLLLYPVPVQGSGASLKIQRAIETVNEKGLGDVIILARGGGSLEELWAFNEREVARAIFHSKIPIVSAIGHETDFTIADFVADLRAPTPSAAAELVLPEKIVLKTTLSMLTKRLITALSNLTKIKRNHLMHLLSRPSFKQPYHVIYDGRLALDEQSKQLLHHMKTTLRQKQMALQNLMGKLDAMSPLNVLSRGYGFVRHGKTSKMIKTIAEVSQNDTIDIEITDGKLFCVVQNVKSKGGHRNEK